MEIVIAEQGLGYLDSLGYDQSEYFEPNELKNKNVHMFYIGFSSLTQTDVLRYLRMVFHITKFSRV